MGTNKDWKIFIAGHRGLAGSAIHRAFERKGYARIVTRTRHDLDLLDGAAVESFFARERPEAVVLAAARVGGIHANNTLRGQFIFENLQVQNNVIHQAYVHGVRKLLFLGSSCIYPRDCPQPMKEEYLLSGPLEPTNRPYAIAKIAGVEMCDAYRRQYGCNFISVMPTNLYGPNDYFNIEHAHVLPAMIYKFHHAHVHGLPSVGLWGSGSPCREFLHADDLGEAVVFLMERFDSAGIVNIGTGTDITIRDLAGAIAKVVGYRGAIEFDPIKPDGTPRKLLNVDRINGLGWKARIGLEEGLRSTYVWFRDNVHAIRT